MGGWVFIFKSASGKKKDGWGSQDQIPWDHFVSAFRHLSRRSPLLSRRSSLVGVIAQSQYTSILMVSKWQNVNIPLITDRMKQEKHDDATDLPMIHKHSWSEKVHARCYFTRQDTQSTNWRIHITCNIKSSHRLICHNSDNISLRRLEKCWEDINSQRGFGIMKHRSG